MFVLTSMSPHVKQKGKVGIEIQSKISGASPLIMNS